MYVILNLQIKFTFKFRTEHVEGDGHEGSVWEGLGS